MYTVGLPKETAVFHLRVDQFERAATREEFELDNRLALRNLAPGYRIDPEKDVKDETTTVNGQYARHYRLTGPVVGPVDILRVLVINGNRGRVYTVIVEGKSVTPEVRKAFLESLHFPTAVP